MRPFCKRLCGVAILVGTVVCGPIARAEDAPKPQSKSAPGEQRQGPGMMLGRLAENLAKLDLTPEQRTKVDDLIAESKTQLQATREQLKDGDRQAMGEKLRAIILETRTKLQEILTPEQQEKLRDLTQQQFRDRNGDDRKNDESKRPEERKPKGDSSAKNPPPMNPDEPAMQDGGGKSAKATKADVAKTTAAPPMIEVGQSAPDFSLKSIDDKSISFAPLKGRVIVLVFGSYSTPSFRQRVASLEKLAKDYSTKVTFLVIYTREAHAVGEWEVERNKDDEILVEQPKTEADRKALASQAANTLKITIPVLIDGMDDAVAKAYGLSPNGAVIIGRDGCVAARQRWFEPIALRQQLTAVLAPRATKE